MATKKTKDAPQSTHVSGSSANRTRRAVAALVAELNTGNLELWDIVSALRGPDHETTGMLSESALKDMTTARIRSMVGLSDELPIVVNHGPLSNEQAAQVRLMLYNKQSSGSRHFDAHVHRAIRAIQRVGLARPHLLNFPAS